ncbi:MAG: pyridoxamine 5'-phosphate oxidase family protein [Vicinamibacterales bacterium]
MRVAQRQQSHMNAIRGGLALLFVLLMHGGSLAQAPPPAATPPRAEVIAAAREIMQAARYCTFVTIGPAGQPQARIVDPFQPDADLTIFIATNPLTRKVTDIRRDPRVTLLYFVPASSEYVTVVGTAVVDTDAGRKAGHWKPEWAGLYKDQNRGDDYQLLRVKPSRLEVVSVKRGINNDPKTWRPVSVDVPQ